MRKKTMLNSIEALFYGQVFHPDRPVELKPNTRVRIIIENVSPAKHEPNNFLDTAASLNLEKPSDWSANLDRYLYSKDAH